MRYEMMFPDEIRKAIDENIPVVMALGVLEYHSEHLSVGVDTLLIVRALDILEQEIPMVIIPPFYYGASSFAVEPPERNGTVHIDTKILQPFARQLFYNLLRIGFRNIHIYIHHQCENFAEGMPTDLSFKLAAREEMFAYIERARGEGWWGDKASADYYQSHEAGENPFNWISVHPFMTAEAQAQFPVDHAGKQETSLMMSFCKEAVDMNRFTEDKWYSNSAKTASVDYGNRAKEIILSDIRKHLAK